MLSELKSTRQISGEPYRRWFSGGDMDLIVWHDDSGKTIGFQLCYRRGSGENALTWLADRGFAHNRIDDGEGRMAHHKMTPILVADGAFDRDDVVDRFRAASETIDPAVRDYVLAVLRGYPAPLDVPPPSC